MPETKGPPDPVDEVVKEVKKLPDDEIGSYLSRVFITHPEASNFAAALDFNAKVVTALRMEGYFT